MIILPILRVEELSFITKTVENNCHSIFKRMYQFSSDYWWQAVLLYCVLPISLAISWWILFIYKKPRLVLHWLTFYVTTPNLVMDSGVHASLHVDCHLQIICVKSNLQIYCPPPYERFAWHYKHANAVPIRKAINGFNWERPLANENVAKQNGQYFQWNYI